MLFANEMQEAKENQIIMEGSSYASFSHVLHYIYTGELKFNPANAELAFAMYQDFNKYLLHDAEKVCSTYLTEHIDDNPEYALSILASSSIAGHTNIVQLCLMSIARNAKQLVTSGKFFLLEQDMQNSILQYMAKKDMFVAVQCVALHPLENLFVFSPNDTYSEQYLLTGFASYYGNLRRSFLRFQIPALSVPSNAKITKAYLRLVGYPIAEFTSATNAAQVVSVHHVPSIIDWKMKFSSQPAFDDKEISTCVVTDELKVYEWDVTSLVQQVLQNGELNMMLKNQNEQCLTEAAKYFYSSRTSTKHAPQLVIYFCK